MQFYKIEGINEEEPQKNVPGDDRRENRRDRANDISVKTNMFNRKADEKAFFFVSSVASDTVSAGIITNINIDPEQAASDFLRKVGLTVTNINIEEATFSHVCRLMKLQAFSVSCGRRHSTSRAAGSKHP